MVVARRGPGWNMGLAHPEVRRADGLAADGFQAPHPGGLGGLAHQVGRCDVMQRAVERVDVRLLVRGRGAEVAEVIVRVLPAGG
jgi:hypothetical protein